MYRETICVICASNCSMSALLKSLAACRLVSLPEASGEEHVSSEQKQIRRS